jgi:O-antigen ligase
MIKKTALFVLLLSGPLLAFSVRGFAPMLAIAGLTAIVALFTKRPNWNSEKFKPYLLPIATLGFVLISSLWSISERGFDTALRLTLVICFTLALITLLDGLSPEEKRLWKKRLSLSISIGIVFATLIGPYNIYWPDLPNVVANYFDLLRQVNNALTILPAFLFILLAAQPIKSRALLTTVLVIIGGITLVSESQTSFLALLLGLISFVLAKISVRLCRHIIFVSLALCTLMSPFIFSAAYDNQWVETHAPKIVTERGAGEIRQWIYHVYAKESLQKPLFGHGLNASKYFKPENIESYAVSASDRPGLRGYTQGAAEKGSVASHPHNLFLQLIFEFGYLGALFILATIWQAFARVANYPDAQRTPYFWAAIAATMATVLFGLTLWHSWLMAAVGYLVVFSRFSRDFTLHHSASRAK